VCVRFAKLLSSVGCEIYCSRLKVVLLLLWDVTCVTKFESFVKICYGIFVFIECRSMESDVPCFFVQVDAVGLSGGRVVSFLPLPLPYPCTGGGRAAEHFQFLPSGRVPSSGRRGSYRRVTAVNTGVIT
jgi:hypothetical protein